MSSKKQTAVEWLWEQIPLEFSSSRAAFDALQQAKELEKQQHGNTWDDAIKTFQERGEVEVRAWEDFDDYFAETYGGNNTTYTTLTSTTINGVTIELRKYNETKYSVAIDYRFGTVEHVRDNYVSAAALYEVKFKESPRVSTVG